MGLSDKEYNALDPRNDYDGGFQKVLNREVYYPGEDIIRQKEEGYRAYYIEKGTVEVLIQEGQHVLKVAELGSGDIFGEMALINNQPRSATIRAVTETTLTVISRQEIETKICKVENEAVCALIDILCHRLRHATFGQLQHYCNLLKFQDRITGIVKKVHRGIDDSKRDEFREEIEPLLEDLQAALDRYTRKL